MLGRIGTGANPKSRLEVENLTAVRDHVVFEHRHRVGIFPARGHYVPVNQPVARLRGVPAIMPLTQAAVNTQRVATAGLVLGVVAGLAPAAAVPLLAGAMAFQLGFGARQGLRMAYNFGQQQRTLNAEARQMGPGPYNTPITAAVARLNKENRLRAKTSYLPAGGLSAVVNIMTATSVLLRPPLLGQFSPAAVAASITLMHVAVPLISFFSLTSSAYGCYYIAFSYSREKRSGDILKCPVTGHEPMVHQLMGKRFRTARRNAVASTAGNLAMAVGAPLLFAIGPYALILIVPAAIVSTVTSYTWARKVAYLPQFTQEERLGFRSRHTLVNETARAHHNYAELKALKGQLRPLFPYAKDSPMKYFVRPWNKLHQRLRPQFTAGLPSAEHTVRTYWRKHLDWQQDFLRGRERINVHKLQHHMVSGNAAGAARRQRQILATRADMVAVDEAQRAIPTPGTASAATCFNWLVDMMLEEKAFPTFARKLINDKGLFATWRARGFTQEGKQWVVNAVQLRAAFAVATPAQQHTILARAYVHARTALLNFVKLGYQYRARELIDILALHLRAAARMRQGA